jgi:hypothetical protein
MDSANFDLEQFKKLLERTRTFYQGLGEIFCPALNASISFNSDGFHHLRFDGTRAERSKQEQNNKLRCLKTAIEILKITTTIQEYRKTLQPFGKTAQDGFKKTSEVEYWGFIAIMKDIRIKVVVRKIGSGQPHFWSVMPFWTRVDGAEASIKIFATNKIENE